MGDHESGSMRRMMKMVEHQSSMGSQQDMSFLPKQTLEINPAHPVIVKLNETRLSEPTLAEMVTEQLFDYALVTAGLLNDSRTMLPRLNKIMDLALNKSGEK